MERVLALQKLIADSALDPVSPAGSSESNGCSSASSGDKCSSQSIDCSGSTLGW